MKAKKKTTVELTPDEVSAIIKKYFAEHKDIVIQDVNFNVEHKYGEYPDNHGYHELDSIICTREDEIDV